MTDLNAVLGEPLHAVGVEITPWHISSLCSGDRVGFLLPDAVSPEILNKLSTAPISDGESRTVKRVRKPADDRGGVKFNNGPTLVVFTDQTSNKSFTALVDEDDNHYFSTHQFCFVLPEDVFGGQPPPGSIPPQSFPDIYVCVSPRSHYAVPADLPIGTMPHRWL